ncbi:MAG: hypothetical protein ACQES0_11160 [Bacteroidota bacterium]
MQVEGPDISRSSFIGISSTIPIRCVTTCKLWVSDDLRFEGFYDLGARAAFGFKQSQQCTEKYVAAGAPLVAMLLPFSCTLLSAGFPPASWRGKDQYLEIIFLMQHFFAAGQSRKACPQ